MSDEPRATFYLWGMLLPRHLIFDAAALRQTFRIVVACAVAYVTYKSLDLKQGYWSVFTVLIVMQGSIGGTLGAAFDRLLGTLVGAGLGALGTMVRDGGGVTEGIALVGVVGMGSYAAVLRPQLKIAPVTASIMMLTAPSNSPVGLFMIDRVVEIMLGGTIGVAVMASIFPVRSGDLVAERSAAALEVMHGLLADMAIAIKCGSPAAFAIRLAALRPVLTGVEQALKDADREHATRLWRHAIPPAVPRTLWRIRSDLVLVARSLDSAIPVRARSRLGTPSAQVLRRFGDEALACAIALRAKEPVKRVDTDEARRSFSKVRAEFRDTTNRNALEPDVAAHIFGLSFALDELYRNLADLADRIDEINK